MTGAKPELQKPCPSAAEIAGRVYACQRPQVQSGAQKRHWRHEYTAPLKGDATIKIVWTEVIPVAKRRKAL